MCSHPRVESFIKHTCIAPRIFANIYGLWKLYPWSLRSKDSPFLNFMTVHLTREYRFELQELLHRKCFILQIFMVSEYILTSFDGSESEELTLSLATITVRYSTIQIIISEFNRTSTKVIISRQL